ncbi:MAG: hypothetical protein U9N86_16525 [Bacteroidota bacterium]|nr:hypothetical protein [Bacteroidota bacterium]
MEDTINYIKEIFGIDINIVETQKNQIGSLPFYIVNDYIFWDVILFGRNTVFASKKSREHFTPDQYKKQLELLEQNFKIPVVLVLPDIEAYRRNRLIQKHINFVIANKQIFIPSLVIDLKEYTFKARKKKYLQPAAQCLILYHLQTEQLNHYNYKQLSDALGYPYLTITRAVKNIQDLELCKVEGTKEKTICFEISNTELWEKALTFMKSPVIKKVFINNEIGDSLAYISNINALSYYSNLNDEKQIYLAVHQDIFNKLRKAGEIKDTNDFDGKYCIEIWKYPPAILANNEYVDPLSLFLEFRNDIDERIQMSLEQIIENQKW